jgi:predicted dehydrogenase
MIRLAIIGLGAVTRNIHLPAYAQLGDQVKVVAGCDVDPTVRESMKKAFSIPEVYEDPKEMLKQTRPDLVVICTPPFMHYEQCLMALEFGCHVFCEKPFVEDLKQADELIQAADRANRYIVVNSQFPCMNIHSLSKQYIGTPEFGRLLFLHAWQTFTPTDHTEAGWRRTMKRRVGFEFGVHVFELIRFFFDAMPVRILAHMPNPSPKLGSEVINIVSMEFADGRAASVLLNRISRGPERYLEMRLDGEHGSIYTSIGGEVSFEAGIRTRTKQPYLGFNLVKGGKATLYHGEKSKVIAKDGINPFASSTAVHLRNFLNAIETGSSPQGLISDNRNTLALALAAYDSVESGKMVSL